VTVLGVDLGTSSVKVVLAGAAGDVLARAGADYPVHRPHPGWAETDPADWWRAVADATARVLADRPGDPPRAVGLSGQMHGVVLTAAGGTPTRPAVLWADARAEPQLAAYRALPRDVRARLGNPLSPGMAGPVLAWLHTHAPDAVAAAAHALQPKDWLRARLTGVAAGEPSDASGTLLYDVLREDWDDAVVAALGFRRDLLPGLLPHSGADAGPLLPEAAAALGLPAGIPVAAGAADTAAALLGSGLPAAAGPAAAVQLTIGTGIQLVTPAPRPTAATLPPAPNTHLHRAATPGGWYAMAASLSGGQTLDWVRRLLGLGWPELYALAARGPRPGDPVFVPHLAGERTPYLDTRLRGAWAGLDARHDRDALCYAALEGVAFAVADARDALPGGGPGATAGEIRLAGGGSVAPAWRQLLADVLGTPLRAVDAADASARGAALLAARAAGLPPGDTAAAAPLAAGALVEPRAAAAGPLRDRLALYRDTLAALRPLPFTPSG
jgi:xylulokinase